MYGGTGSIPVPGSPGIKNGPKTIIRFFKIHYRILSRYWSIEDLYFIDKLCIIFLF